MDGRTHGWMVSTGPNEEFEFYAFMACKFDAGARVGYRYLPTFLQCCRRNGSESVVKDGKYKHGIPDYWEDFKLLWNGEGGGFF